MYLFCSKTRNFRKENGIFCLIITLWKIIHKTALSLHLPRRKQMAPRDMLLIALAVLVLVRVDWRHMNSFHYLILFLLVLCFMLRWSNMRKDARRQELLKKKAEYEATQQSAEDTPAEAVSAEDMTVDGAPVPAEAPAETAEKESDI